MKISLYNLSTVNKNRVTIDNDEYIMHMYFSYQTIVGFGYTNKKTHEQTTRVAQNEWSRTTGKLLNYLEPDKKARIPHTDLLRELEHFMNGTNPYPLPAL